MSKPKRVFSTEYGTLFKGDCMDLFKDLASDSVDTVFADPPFNIGKDYENGFNDSLDEGEYLLWCKKWIDESIRVLKPGGALFIYHLPKVAFKLASHIDEQRMDFRHWIALSMKGTFPRGKRLYPAHYALLYFTKGVPQTFNSIRLPIPVCRHCGKDIKDYGGHRKYLNPEGLNLTDFWEDTSPARHQKDKSRWHVNELKPRIPERCIQMSTNEGDLVLDPFGGGGSTYVCAERLKRRWIGVEVGHTDLIVERFEREFPDTKLYKRGKPNSLIFDDPVYHVCQPA